ncbi:MAG TPA: extracellular solute-binding protein [Burkholderiales bacterium]|nr:extracellular solute-binding protein [Burkholderiales bacterium]
MRLKKSAIVAAVACASMCAGVSWATAPAPYKVTPELVKAAQKEGKVSFYTSIGLKVAQKLANAFEKKYPGINVELERSGAERIFQRINQEYSAKIYNADVYGSSDAVQFVDLKNKGWLQPAVPDDIVDYPKDEKDPDGDFAVVRATLSVMGYNTKLVKKADAPKGYKDLLKPEWKGKIVKGHPAYSGTIMTETFDLSHLLGWDYFKKLSEQDVMQVQSATVPPKKVAQGERAIMMDGSEYIVFVLRESGSPIQEIYPVEGTPLISGNAGIVAHPPHPHAARLFYHYIFSTPAQQLLVDEGGLRSFNPNVKDPKDRTPLSKIKLLHSDSAQLGKEVETIKKKYASYFGG